MPRRPTSWLAGFDLFCQYIGQVSRTLLYVHSQGTAKLAHASRIASSQSSRQRLIDICAHGLLNCNAICAIHEAQDQHAFRAAFVSRQLDHLLSLPSVLSRPLDRRDARWPLNSDVHIRWRQSTHSHMLDDFHLIEPDSHIFDRAVDRALYSYAAGYRAMTPGNN